VRAAEHLHDVVDAARTTLARARRMVTRFSATPVRDELGAAVALLGAAGIDARLDLPPGPLPDSEELVKSLREAVSRLLTDETVRHCVIKVGPMAVLLAFSIATELLASPLDSLLSVVFAALYGITLSAYPVVLYLAARLIRVLGELESSRAELAEAAVSRERLRLSRDLHDLFGQSLSAISLKGGLALRLLPDDADAARAEITGLTELARETLHRMRKVSHNEHVVSLRTEIDGAAALLATAGAGTGITADTDGLSPGTEEVFGWAVREGVTNMLRHSEVRYGSIAVAARDGSARLEIVNDGVRGPRGTDGNGLAGLTDRAVALGGSVTAGQVGDEFRLVVEIPEGAG
jgi:two-component system sensor histidine kinase DesK